MKPWLRKLFNAIDNMDAEAFASFLTQDASFKFANAPVVSGRENIRKAVSQFFSAARTLMVCVDKALRPRKIPEKIQEKLTNA